MKHTIVPALTAGLLLLALSACTHFGYTDSGGGDPRSNQQAEMKID